MKSFYLGGHFPFRDDIPIPFRCKSTSIVFTDLLYISRYITMNRISERQF